jgi:hypothetical protein
VAIVNGVPVQPTQSELELGAAPCIKLKAISASCWSCTGAELTRWQQKKRKKVCKKFRVLKYFIFDEKYATHPVKMNLIKNFNFLKANSAFHFLEPIPRSRVTTPAL